MDLRLSSKVAWVAARRSDHDNRNEEHIIILAQLWASLARILVGTRHDASSAISPESIGMGVRKQDVCRALHRQ